MSNNKKNNFEADKTEEENSLIKESSELKVQSLYQILIKNPYLVNTVDDKKETILSYSLKNKNIEVSNLILTSPIIDLDYQDKNGNTYLHLAVNSQQKEIIKILIEKGIYINKQNKDGNTALHLAYIINNTPIINLLLEKGIDKSIVNKENKTAEEIKLKTKKLNSNINLNNRIKVTKNNDFFKKNEPKALAEKNMSGPKKKNSTGPNTKRNRKDNYINKNDNNSKSIASSKSGAKMKVKSMPNQDMKKNSKTTSNKKNSQTNNIINIENNNRNNNNYNYSENNKKMSDFERTIKIDWDITKNNIYKNKENENDRYLNYNIKEKKNSFGKDQDLCNFEDNASSYYCNKNDNFSEKISSNKLKVNKKIFNSTNNNMHPKPKKSDKGNKINNKNNNLENSSTYNPCSSGEFTIRTEKKNSRNISDNMFGPKLDISQSHNNAKVNQNKNESRNNTILNNDNFEEDFNYNYNIKEKDNIYSFHALSGNFNKNKNIINDMNINSLSNNPKRKTETSKNINRNIIISNKIQNKEESNLYIKSSNMESSLVTESRLKTSHKRNNPLIEFLSQINLLKYLNNLDSNGFDDINLLIEEAKKGDIIKDQELKEAGINSPGDRAKILIRIKEKANLFGFTVPKSVYYTLKNYDNIENDQHIIDLNNWLINIKVDRYLMNFVSNGYHSIELLLMQMETENPLTTEILRDEIGIDKIGYRSRILNKLKEEGRSLNNKLKTSVLVVNNRGDDKNCECSIF